MQQLGCANTCKGEKLHLCFAGLVRVIIEGEEHRATALLCEDLQGRKSTAAIITICDPTCKGKNGMRIVRSMGLAMPCSGLAYAA